MNDILNNKIIMEGLGPELLLDKYTESDNDENIDNVPSHKKSSTDDDFDEYLEDYDEYADDYDDDPLNENSLADEAVDYTGYMQDSALKGEYSFDVIAESLTNQFSNYINMEDKTDYVDIFWNQYHESLLLANEEDFPEDIKNAVENYRDKFEALIKMLFYNKLSITLMDLEGESVDQWSVENSTRELYKFFILNARNNFMDVISKSLYRNVDASLDDKSYYDSIHAMMNNFSPIVLAVGPMEFIRLCKNNEEIFKLFNDERVVGNFLRKYSPRLYMNEEFECEIIAQITSMVELKKDIQEGI